MAKKIEEKNLIEDIRKDANLLKKVNVGLNAGACIASCLLSGFNPFIIAGTFIVCDGLSVPLNYLYFKHKYKKESNMDDLDSLDDFLLDNGYKIFEDKDQIKFVQSIIRGRIQVLSDQKKLLDRAKNFDKELEEASRLDKTLQKQQDLFYNGLQKLRTFDYKDPVVPDEKYEEILEHLDELEESLDLNESGFIYLDASFTLFTDETLELLKSFQSMGTSISDENMDKLVHLMNTFDDYIIKTNKKVQKQNVDKINVSYDVLIKNMESKNKKED